MNKGTLLTILPILFFILLSSNGVKAQDNITNSYILVAEGFVKLEFYFSPATNNATISSFLLTVNATSALPPVTNSTGSMNNSTGGANNSTGESNNNSTSSSDTLVLNGNYTVTNLTVHLDTILNRNLTFGSIVWQNLSITNYTVNVQAMYSNGNLSEILLTYFLDPSINQTCSQETFATFFSIEAYSIVPLESYYSFCNYNFTTISDFPAVNGRAAIFNEKSLSMAVLAFRGAQNLNDFTLEHNLSPISCSTVYDFDCDGNIGLGYSISYNSIKLVGGQGNNYLNHLRNLKNNGTSFVLITGHGKGAGEASISMLDVIQLGAFKEVHMTAFGLPAYADGNFTQYWNSLVFSTYPGRIVSTWHYHQDTLGHRDELVYTTADAGGEAVDLQSIYFDTNCTSDFECSQMLVYGNTSNATASKKRALLTVNTPRSGYYYVGADPSVYGYQTDLFLTSFPVTSSSITVAQSPTISLTRSPTPPLSVGASPSASRTASRSFTSSVSFNAFPSSSSTRTPTTTLDISPSNTRAPSSSADVFPSSNSITISSSPLPATSSSPSSSRFGAPTLTYVPTFTLISNSPGNPTPRSRSRSPHQASHSPTRSPIHHHASHSPTRTPTHRNRSPSRTPTRDLKNSSILLSFSFSLFAILLFL